MKIGAFLFIEFASLSSHCHCPPAERAGEPKGRGNLLYLWRLLHFILNDKTKKDMSLRGIAHFAG